ncbi:MAG TPA: TM2 domain-containing protein [Pyrinomonadaceae bacterium]|jgi:TM2 domain-containing membrane protein YozV
MIGCPSCGAENVEGTRFCVKCGTTLPASPQPESWRQSGDLGQQQPQQDYQSSGYSAPQPPPSGYPSYTPQQDPLAGYQQQAGDWMAQGANKKMTAGICGILLGGFGVHKFVLGYNTEGIIMLAACIVGGILTCGLASGAVGIIGLIEGIIYLTKSDEEFVRTYVQNKKPWF